MKKSKHFSAKRIYSHSFAARLIPEQRDALFDSLAGGLKYDDAAVMIRDWMKANQEARLPGSRPGHEITLSSSSPIGKWFIAQKAARRYEKARAAALVAQAQDPASRHALEQARYQAVMEGLRPTEIAAFERNELAREKFEFEQKKLAFQRQRDAVLDQARGLLERADAGEKGANLQQQINLVLAEIEKMRLGEE